MWEIERNKKKKKERERSWKSGQRASLVRYIRVNLNYASANLYRSLIVAKYLFHYPSWSEMKRDMTTRKKKKSRNLLGEKWQDRVTREYFYSALSVFLSWFLLIRSPCTFFILDEWLKKKKRIFARSRIIRLNRDGKIGNFSVIIAFIEKDDDLLPLCVPMCRLKFISYPMRYFDRFFEIRNNHPGIDDIFAARMNGRSMANQGIRPIQNGPRMSRIFRGEANIGHF